jgi:hypothetical protein
MKAPHFPGLGGAAAALLIVAASAADAQRGVAIGGWTAPPSPTFHSPFANGAFRSVPRRHHRGAHGRNGFLGFPGYVYDYDREPTVIIEREVIREVPVIVEAPPPRPPREPYVIGHSYASLPGGCMKLIEDGLSYYYCSGEWYRQAGKQYRAVEQP